MPSSSAASFCTQFDIFSASVSALRSISSSGTPDGGIFTSDDVSRVPAVPAVADLAEPQILRADELALGHQNRALDGILELADVAGPVVAQQHLLRFRVDARRSSS